MIYQGNILLSQNLALVINISKLLDKSDFSEILENQIEKHLMNRFNKSHKEHPQNENVITTSETIQSLMTDQLVFLKEDQIDDINYIVDNSFGKVYLIIIENDKQFNLENQKKLQKAILKNDHFIKIEFFNICNENDSNDLLQFTTHGNEKTGANIQKRQKQNPDTALYHIASRVCTSFVEYENQIVCNRLHDCNHDNNCDKNIISGIRPIHINSLYSEAQKIDESEFANNLNHNLVHKIMDIRDAIDIICETLDGAKSFFPQIPSYMNNIFEGKNIERPEVLTRYKFPFGVWFRGQSRICYDLRPSTYRSKKLLYPSHEGCKKLKKREHVVYDETSILHHFQMHNAEIRDRFESTFEWLCLMQHYQVPTRVLDWSENILTALYFAVVDKNADCDGVIWVLNAGRLNEISSVSKPKRAILEPNCTDVILRSAMAATHSVQDLRRYLIKNNQYKLVMDGIEDPILKKWIEGKCGRLKKLHESDGYQKLTRPVAVFPARINPRLAAQLGTFTIHGGKNYDPKIINNIDDPYRFPKSTPLVQLNKCLKNRDKTPSSQFLDVFVIPSGAKRKIREQLKRIGIHDASLYPELEYQSKYITKQWRIGATDYPNF